MTKSVTIVAAGTGGHVMPGIAVAKILASRGWKVSWIGTEQGMERRLVERHGIAFYPLDFEGLRGKGLKTFLFGGFKLLDCIRVSRKLLRELQTDVNFFNGRLCGGSCLPCSRSCRHPLRPYEQRCGSAFKHPHDPGERERRHVRL